MIKSQRCVESCACQTFSRKPYGTVRNLWCVWKYSNHSLHYGMDRSVELFARSVTFAKDSGEILLPTHNGPHFYASYFVLKCTDLPAILRFCVRKL